MLYKKLIIFNIFIISIEQSRRDDLEAIGYVLLFFLLGILPWQNLKAKAEDERYRKIYEKKASIKSSELCQGLHCKNHIV